MSWFRISADPIRLIAYSGDFKFGVYQHGTGFTVRAMYSPNNENEPEWCDAVKPGWCPTLREAVAQAEHWAKTL